MLAEQLNFGDLEVLELTLVRPQTPAWLAHETAVRLGKPQRNRQSPQEKPREVILRHPVVSGTDRVVIHSADGRQRVEATAGDAEVLRRVLAIGRHAVTWVAQAKDGHLFVHAHLFAAGGLPASGLAIGVDDLVEEKVRENLRDVRAPFGAVRTWLMDQLTMSVLSGSDQVRVIHSSAPSADGSAQPRAFTLLGSLWAADVAMRDGKPQVTRLVEVSRRRGERWPRLSYVPLSFVSASSQAEASEALRAALAGLAEEGKSYLELWRAYDDLERNVLIRDALDLGVPRYDSWKFNDDGTWNFFLSHDEIAHRFLRQLQRRDEVTELEAAEDPPGELTGGGRSGRAARGTVRRAHPESWSIDVTPAARGTRLANDPAPRGVLFLALTGSRISHDRRATARDRIWSGTAEMRGLAQLIEGVGVRPAEPRSIARYKKALPRVIRDSFTTGPATQSQRIALEMALKTPDVLLVQGPPGTGKTQFITALLRCLDAVGESARAFNRTLITSYQHDAVDNVVSKARNRGLPPTRIDSDEDRGRQSAQLLRTEIVQRVKHHVEGRRPEVARRQRLQELQTLVASYDEAPTTAGDQAEMLERAEKLAAGALPTPLAERLAKARLHIKAQNDARRSLLITQHSSALRAARSLRTTHNGFADDGPDRAARAIPVLDTPRLLTDTDRDLLERAADWTQTAQTAAPPFLAELATLRTRLLEQLGGDSKMPSPAPARDPEVQVLLHEIAAAAEAHADTQPDSVDAVLADYLADLNSNVALIQDTLNRYNAVLAATVQQVDSPAMYRVLDAPLPVFGTVVIDEAARANPLDLMIPMACARDRIVLVGDHKQLPHAMERRIEQELERTGKVSDLPELRRSLFQRWFGIFGNEDPAVRTITLDEQFRMHPALGRFVSQVFYGSPDAVRSHLSTDALTHLLEPYRGKVAGWIDVPHDGKETRVRHSVVRQREAERLVAELKALADQDTDRQLSFGVISFYKSQVAAIRDELLNAELLVPDDEDPEKIKPVPRMEWTAEPRPRPRLRVGSVDAFQGMEFDVVLLSVTRSSPPDHDSGTREALQRYGHLTSEQRMCVAMSRQRRLLLAVGDAAMADRATAPADPADPNRSLVEGLVAFLELCKGPYGAGVRS